MLAAACSAEGPSTSPGADPPPRSSVTVGAEGVMPVPETDASPAAEADLERCRRGEIRQLRSSTTAFAAVAVGDTVAYVRPGGRALATFDATTAQGFPTVYGVLSEIVDGRCKPVWYRVQLPMRPNGSTGYVRARAVELAPIQTRVVVDLSLRRVDLLRSGERVLRLTAAVGSPETPTPTGSFYVNQRVSISDAFGPYGPAALGISGFSPVLQGWAEGGPIAIHGTNEPESIGQAASHGCMRLENGDLKRLFRLVPAGTPVVIRA